ncbi:hypothetical protein BC826DRAFT_965446 [Russula brevipes]|nr:hypothetical protein BC826DRAFT_965446 [Russula brevipes]
MILARRIALACASSSRLRAFAPPYATSSPPSDAVSSPKAPPPPPVTTRPSPPPKAPSTSARPRRSRRKGKKEIEGPLLQPYQLSNRLIALCEQGDVDLAFKTLQRAPQNAQNIKVWNTLIKRFMIAKKFKLAYNVFTDLKRRGFVPNIRTYSTLMTGYATIEDWEQYTKQLGSAHSVYKQLKEHLKTPGQIDDPSGELGVSFALYPIALYISILGKAGKYQKAFDVFHELDIDGPLAPHPKVYSSLLCVLADRVDAADEEAETIEQSVSHAKYVWRQHMRSLDRQPQFYIESRSVDAMIKVLSRGSPSDHELMFDILRDICGLPRLEEPDYSAPPPPSPSPSPPPPVPTPKVTPTVWILNETLDGCIVAGRPEMVVHYAQSIMDKPELRSILRPSHLHGLLLAQTLLAKKGSLTAQSAEKAAEWVEWILGQLQVRAAQSRDRDQDQDQGHDHEGERGVGLNKHTIAFAFEICYLCSDGPAALRIARAVLQGSAPASTSTHTRLSGYSMPAKSWAHLFRLASMAPQSEKQECLELLSAHRAVLDIWETPSAFARLAPTEKKDHVSLARFMMQLLWMIPSSVDRAEVEGLDVAEVKRREALSDLRRRALSFLEQKENRR